MNYDNIFGNVQGYEVSDVLQGLVVTLCAHETDLVGMHFKKYYKPQQLSRLIHHRIILRQVGFACICQIGSVDIAPSPLIKWAAPWNFVADEHRATAGTNKTDLINGLESMIQKRGNDKIALTVYLTNLLFLGRKPYCGFVCHLLLQ